MNILICSVGTRCKIVQYFKNALNGSGRVIATDMSPLAPALYEADSYYIVPPISDSDYINVILKICESEKITAILSLIDPELSLIAAKKQEFLSCGVTVVGSDYETCERCLNKWKMYSWLQSHGYACARSYIDKESFYYDIDAGVIRYPVFVKPVCGSASMAISKVYDQQTIELLTSQREDLMIQEYLSGQEIGADVYVDMLSNEVVSIFTKKKIVMRAGETDKAVSFKDDRLFTLIDEFVYEMGLVGQIDIDIFDMGGKYYISEVNPRFGGGYPHAYECSCDHTKMIINNLQGKINERRIGAYPEGIYMMKYNELLARSLRGGNSF